MTHNEIARKLIDAGFVLKQTTRHRQFHKNGETVLLPLSSHGSSAPWVVDHMKTAIRRAERGLSPAIIYPKHRPMTHGEAKLGRSVRSRRSFIDVPAGTTGRIEDDYGAGFFVRWDNGVRDAFDKNRELVWLEAVA